MQNEIKIFFTAIMYYTRIPCPRWVGHDENYLNKATKYFPLIGWIVGGVSGLVFFVFNLLFGSSIAVLFSMVSSILLTGAFHEDGFADVCDGFGGGWTKEKILSIMKDSRLGTYGVIGLILLLAIKYLALTTLIIAVEIYPVLVVLILIVSHSLSRLTASTFIFTQKYVRLSEDSKVKPVAQTTSISIFLVAFFIGFLPFGVLILYTGRLEFLLLLIPVFLFREYLGRYFKKWIGGYTGDCLGASQQIFEVVIYLSLIIIWKFI